jgi:hypothetical protein
VAAKENPTSIIPGLDELFGADRPGTLAFLEGLELIRAFVKIEREEDRQKVIELAKRLSSNDP